MKRSIRFTLWLLVVIALLAGSAMTSSAAPAMDTKPSVVRLTPIGHPTWKPVDFHLFSAPIGTVASGYAEFYTTMQNLLPPPNHVRNDAFGGVGPGAPHQPPYNTELAQGVANLGYHEGQPFNPSEFSNGNGVWLAWMTVPNPGTTGSSPDFASGPIIPNSLFRIHIYGVTIRNNASFNPYVADFKVPALDATIDPLFDGVEGHSHFPVFIADNMDFGPAGTKPQGSYEYQIKMMDQQGNGWSIVARFTVTARPE
jgi:hypothetical protein